MGERVGRERKGAHKREKESLSEQANTREGEERGEKETERERERERESMSVHAS
jgi:hypothetical protein